MTAYLASLMVFAGINALLALGLNVVWGLGGMVNLGLAGFFALGAYASALLSLRLGWPMPLAGLAAAGIAAAFGAVLATVTARLKGDYLALVTLGFAQVVQLIAANERWLTSGTDGISGVPGPWRSMLSPMQFDLLCMTLCWGLVAFCWMALARLASSPFARVLRALREDEMVAAVAGKRVLWFKIRAFALGTGVSGLAGSIYVPTSTAMAYRAGSRSMSLLTLNVVLALTLGGTNARSRRRGNRRAVARGADRGHALYRRRRPCAVSGAGCQPARGGHRRRPDPDLALAPARRAAPKRPVLSAWSPQR